MDAYEKMVKDAWLKYAGVEMPPGGITPDWKSYCMFYKILTPEERKAFLQSANPAYLEQLQVAHILGKQAHPDKKYDLDNVVLINAVAHRRLDTYLDPITQEHMTYEERMGWFQRIKQSKTIELPEVQPIL